ncbi:MAG: hypothetical protein ACFCVC_00995 [Acidimicrobiia bacterium]
MQSEFEPRTFKMPIEGIADNFFVYPHFRAFVETDSDSPTVLATTNELTEPAKVDFHTAIGGTHQDGRSGVLVYMRYTGTPRMGDAVTFTLWQQAATVYGAPEPMTETGFDTNDPMAGFAQVPVPSARREPPHPVA